VEALWKRQIAARARALQRGHRLSPTWASCLEHARGMDTREHVWDPRASMLSTVAVGTDGSATASEAVKVAADIAQRFDAKLVLLSAYEKAPPPVSEGGASEELQWAFNKDARVSEILRRTEEDLRDRKIDCTSMADEGEPARVLTRLASECGADLLVIGNRGMHRRVLGSVPNSVTHNAPCSVYVVKTT
jgi:nucleotide-binding universal stress UspA family protein